MNDRVLQFRVGAVLVASVAIMIVLIIWFNGMPNVFADESSIFIQFDRAPGVNKDTPVRKSGILIGRVTGVRLMEDRTVLVETTIDTKYMPYENERARIISGSLLGDAVVEFVPGEAEKPAAPLPDGTTIRGDVAADPMRVLVNLETDMTEAMASIKTAAEDVSSLAASLDKVVNSNEDQFTRVVGKSELALDQFTKTMATVDEIAGDDEMKARLKKALEDLPALLTESREMVAALQRASGHAETNLKNLEGFTEPLGRRGSAMVANLEQSTENLNQLLQALATLSAELNSRNGTVGMLVHDRELYDKLDRAASNIEDLSWRLRPVVNDVRVFTDKIARDPRQLGVRGALERRSATTKW